MFRSPRPLDLTATVTEKTPDDWLAYVSDAERERMTFLPLADGAQRRSDDGWCTYAGHIGDSPDVEILCGGMNHKRPDAAAVWRQGNLLHFGFEESPAELNDNGRKLLENCIVYVAGFAADRPLVRTPSVFVDADYPRPRHYTRSALWRDGADAAAIAKNFAEPWRTELAALDLAAFRRWFQRHEGQICAGDGGKLALDADALALGLPLGEPGFFAGAKRALADPARRERALALLRRRVPDGPDGDAAAWQEWLAANLPFLFWLEEGGYQWHVDPLARARGVPCAELRGPARAGR